MDNNQSVPYQNSWLKIIEEPAPYPTEAVKRYALVDAKPGVGVVVIDGDAIYLADEFKPIVKRRYVALFCGALEDGEEPLAAAKRELFEEAGIAANKWTYLGATEPIIGRVHGAQHLFVAQDLTFGEASPELGEDIKVVKLPFSRVIEMVMSNEIEDIRTCLGILKTAKILGKL